MANQRLLLSIIIGISDVQVFTSLLLQWGKKTSVNPHTGGGEHGAKYNRILPHMRGINHYLNEQIPTSHTCDTNAPIILVILMRLSNRKITVKCACT